MVRFINYEHKIVNKNRVVLSVYIFQEIQSAIRCCSLFTIFFSFTIMCSERGSFSVVSLEDSHPMATTSNNHWPADAIHAPVVCVCSGLANDEIAICVRFVLRGNDHRPISYTVLLLHHIQNNNTSNR